MSNHVEKDSFLAYNLSLKRDIVISGNTMPSTNKVYSTEGTCWSVLQREYCNKTRSTACLTTKRVIKMSRHAFGLAQGATRGSEACYCSS